jgi:GT2 family glycosyltransferase
MSAPAAPKATIVVLNWNGRDDTLECLQSLRSVDYPRFDIMVVDNGSQDGSVAMITARFPELKVIETGRNLGYAGGNNVGLRHALDHGAEFVLLLNNDTTVHPHFLQELVAVAQDHPDAAFFSPKIYFYAEPGRIWYAGGRWIEDRARFSHVGYGKQDTGENFNAIKEVDYACGCALLVRASAVPRIGLLDERFFLIFEETDWCYRARDAGFKSIFVPRAIVWHKVSTSFGGSASPIFNYFTTRNRLLWGRKHLSAAGFIALCRAIYREEFPPFGIDSGAAGSYPRKLYWACVQYYRELRKRLATREFRACLYGVRDFALGRFGNPASTLEKFK